ncbi:hypothetical protein AB7M16_002316 [Bradyrhizobium sp. USDA 372]
MRPNSSAPAVVSRNASSHGVCTSRENSTTTAITAAIAAICVCVSPGSTAPTSRNTIVAHNSEPPYLTTKAGNPSGNPYQRSDSPQTITASARPARISEIRIGATG